MDLTPEQFEKILKSVLADELSKHFDPLKASIDGLIKKVNLYLKPLNDWFRVNPRLNPPFGYAQGALSLSKWRVYPLLQN